MRNSSFSSLATANANLFVFERQSRSVELITFIVSVLTIVVGLVGNLLLSLTIATSAALRTPMNTFVLSIGLVDLLTSVFLLPLRVFVERQLVSHQEIDPTIYGVELFVRTFTDITRLFLMMSLSVERYQSIANPLSVSKVQAKRRALIMSGMTWTVSIILSGISIRYFCDTVLHQPCLDSTSGTTTNWGNLEVFVELPLTILSILLIAVCYSLIVMILRQQRRKMAGHLKPKLNQVMPVDSSKMSQLELNNGSKVKISETKEKTSNIKLNSKQDGPQQSPVNAPDNGERIDGVSNCAVKNESYSDNVKIGNAADHDTKLHISNTESNKVKPDGIENNDIEVPQQVYNNYVRGDINSNTGNQTTSHENIDIDESIETINENIENINYGSHFCSAEKKRKMSTSSRSPLITNYSEIVTESNDCLCEDAKVSVEECQLVNETNTATTHTITHCKSTVEGNQVRLSLQDTKQSGSDGIHSLPDSVSATELTDNVSSLPQKDQSNQRQIHKLETVLMQLTNDNGDTYATMRAQPSLSIQSSDRSPEIQNSVGRGKQRQSVQSRAAASNPKASPRLRNIHSQRLQSVIAFLHAREPSRVKNKISNKNTTYHSSSTPTDFKGIPGPEATDHNPSPVSNFSNPQNSHTDQHTHVTNDNPITPSAIDLNSHSPSSLSDFIQETSSRNTTLHTSVDGDLDHSHEHLLQNSTKDAGSITLSCEHSPDNRCSDDMPTHNNNPSILEISASDRQPKSTQLATNRINSPSHQQVTEYIETKDDISMPEISIVDTSKRDIPNSVDSSLQTHSGDQKTTPTDKSNDKGQDKSLQVTEGSKHVEIVDMDGTVHLQIVNAQSSAPIEGAVCLMNPRNKEQGKRRVELKAAIKVGLIVCCFACLWMPLPLSVCILRGTSCWTDSMKVDMLAVFSSLATSTAAIDPILYGLLNPQIRSALQAALYKIRRKMMYYCAK